MKQSRYIKNYKFAALQLDSVFYKILYMLFSMQALHAFSIAFFNLLYIWSYFLHWSKITEFNYTIFKNSFVANVKKNNMCITNYILCSV